MKLTKGEAAEVADQLNFKRKLSGMDLVVAITRAWPSGDVLMQAYMNREALVRTLTTGKVVYWSTSRRELWIKGETSGCPQMLRGFSIDCDGDSVLLDVKQKGPACHKGLDSCFDTLRRIDEKDLEEELIKAIKEGALSFGEFTLTSGKKSRYYLDIKRITTHPDQLGLISALIASRLTEDIDILAGPELGAVPIVTAVALRSGLPYAMIRKEARSHGTGRKIEGELEAGQKALLIDDVTTSGGSLIKSVEALRATGAEVVRVICVVDRMEGASEELEAATGLRLEPILTVEDLGIKP